MPCHAGRIPWLSLAFLFACTSPGEQAPPADPPPVDDGALDVLILGGRVLDGAGNPWVLQDVGIAGDRIHFVGRAAGYRITARDTIDASGLLVTPGLWDAHSHAELETADGKTAAPFLFQGITTVVLGMDGGGTNEIDSLFAHYEREGVGVNTLHFVGHGAARRAVMGNANREPTVEEMEQLRAFVRKGMEEGAFGLSTGLFYVPGYYAKTAEVIALNRIAAEYGGIYDTHDRDLGANYQDIGFLASMQEAIEIGETAGTPVIFSHLNMQGAHNYGRAPEAIALIDAARARGVNVMAAQHPYTATQSNLSAYAIPRWATAGGDTALMRRFDDPDTARILDVQTTEMLAIRGGPGKIMIVDPRPELNGRTVADVARLWNLPVPETVRRILRDGNAAVMNHDLYDIENTRRLAQQEWMMTCTDGRTPHPGQETVHPRVYGALSNKLRRFVLDEQIVTMPFAIRGMTSLPSTFFGVPERGQIREGFVADIAIFDEAELRDMATYEEPHQFSRGTIHVIVNGRFAIRNGELTGDLAGRPIRRGNSAGGS
jgi:N-acyl-D-amino-acid deacylase